MEGGGSVALPLKKNGIESGLTQLQTKWGELEKGFQDWVCKQPLPVETAAVAATRALQGAAEGLFYGTLAKSEVARQLFPFEIFGGTMLLKARSLAVLRGTSGAMICALKRIRGGKDDTEARAFAGFTSGFMFQTFTHSPPRSGPDAIAVGLFFAVCQVVGHEV
ncbi:chloroplastic import inner membrane translocase subunit HP30-2-like [Papaver somniferum]|uniref:chloroplastic import inner membrane translocase subunit HP30-2-like n=1 Tax=Papaver somniferum TaxID=3469 RepID=UPI000E6FCF31|nr:chloroplastic import inner membrane translocase subunit HP30-2-like [Papaver somniferum]